MTFDPTQPQQPPQEPRHDTAPASAPQRPMVPSFIPPSVAAAALAPTPRSRVSAGTIGFVLAIVVAAAGLGFAGGRLTAPPAATNGRTNFGANGGAGGNGPTASGGVGRNGGGFGGGAFNTGDISLLGQVTAIADGSITIQTAGGQNVTIQVPTSVTYHAQAGAAATDVKVGSSVQLTVTRPNFRPDASGAPIASQQTTNGGAGFQLSATDILVLSK
jgi:hypothetical protein